MLFIQRGLDGSSNTSFYHHELERARAGGGEARFRRCEGFLLSSVVACSVRHLNSASTNMMMLLCLHREESAKVDVLIRIM